MTRPPLRVPAGRSEQAAVLVATASIPGTLRPSLMPRGAVDQGIVTGVAITIAYETTVFAHDVLEALARRLAGRQRLARALAPAFAQATGQALAPADEASWRRLPIAVDLAATAAGFALQATFRQRPGERLARGLARTVGHWLSTAASAGAAAGALQELVVTANRQRRRRSGHHRRLHSLPVVLLAAGGLASALELRRHHQEARDPHLGSAGHLRVGPSMGKALGVAVAADAALAVFAAGEQAVASVLAQRMARTLPGPPARWRPVGHLASLAALAATLQLFMHRFSTRIEQSASLIEPAVRDRLPTSPLVSGGPGSRVGWETLGQQGRRYVASVLTIDQIAEVMGSPAVAEPIRLYVGLDSAPTEADRVRLAMDELERVAAFERALLVVISPTGTGYVNYVAVEAVEYLTRGDVACVALQYSKRPSPLSLDRVGRGRHHHRMLLQAIHARLGERPPARRGRLALFGESLGAHTSQDAFLHRGTRGLLGRGVDRALWIGTPYGSAWKRQVLAGGADPDVDRSLVGIFDHFEQVERLDPAARRRLRYFMVTHDNDAVAKFGLDLLVQAPDWLGDRASRSPTVPCSQRWSTPVTFLQTLVDMKNAMHVVPGRFEANGHDYRADLARFVREAYALDATDRQMAAIEAALRANERARRQWLDRHPAAPPPGP